MVFIMSADGDHARRQDDCLLTSTLAPLKREIGVHDTQSWTPLVSGPAANEVGDKWNGFYETDVKALNWTCLYDQILYTTPENRPLEVVPTTLATFSLWP